MTGRADDVFDLLGLTEYEETALEQLISLGQTSAPNLAEATGIPKARIYGVLDALSDRGFIKVIPGRPKQYQSKAPAEILDRAVENQRQEYEQFEAELDSRREAFLSEYEPLFERATESVTPTSELFHVVDVGEPSERETRRIYDDAERELLVMSKSFEYFDSVRPAFEAALDRGIDVSVLLVDPERLSEENRAVQAGIVEEITESYPDVGVRFSEERLPWRGTVADPSMAYDSGTAILLVQEDEVPNHMRQAAITDNGAFVAGLKRYFDLVWEYESLSGSG
ncbi:Sugar-specific transcriptional regulator TrmB [Halomicrobium zhouii]|uniref:Sugar-specific transcriptional regulator TrmB n=1 Tax=Halomicrobium zhouii TaxID=767519 RepID=A0A1I6LT28_9EURY|nr:helix-turn-helix domain-containing protein [Halomicrobium zhouii]SFS06576.1 Sugar-specific transcriptional regulator TrmB [Halomicrobium zhouii]